MGRLRLLSEIKRVRSHYSLHGEIRWTKASSRHFEAYRELVDVFFNDPYARYVLFSVNQSSPEWRAFSSRKRMSSRDARLSSVYHQFLLCAFGPLRDTKRWWVYPDAGYFSKDTVLNRVEFLFNRTYKKQ